MQTGGKLAVLKMCGGLSWWKFRPNWKLHMNSVGVYDDLEWMRGEGE